MPHKFRIIATVIVTVLVFAVGIYGIWYIMEHPIRGVSRETRAGRLGSGTGTLAAILYGIIWMPVLIRTLRKKRELKEDSD